MSTVLRIDTQGNIQTVHHGAVPDADALGVRIALIQALIPLGLQAVEEALQHEVRRLAARSARGDGAPQLVRWGRQRDAVSLADQTLPVLAPRVRNRQAGVEVPRQRDARLQQPRAADQGRR